MDGERERRQLQTGARSLGLVLTAPQCDRLLEFLQLLRKWNRRFNLTSVTDPAEMISRHLLDSLSAAAVMQGERILDLGSGAGLPGVPLAILRPAVAFTLLDSRTKRSAFLTQAALELGLGNVQVVTARAEELRDVTFDTVLVRAFGTLGRICSTAAHLLREQGILVAMKGRVSAAELREVSGALEVREVRTIEVPGVEAERNLVVIGRKA